MPIKLKRWLVENRLTVGTALGIIALFAVVGCILRWTELSYRPTEAQVRAATIGHAYIMAIPQKPTGKTFDVPMGILIPWGASNTAVRSIEDAFEKGHPTVHVVSWRLVPTVATTMGLEQGDELHVIYVAW